MQSKRRHWGLRFLLLLIVAGVGVHFARPFVPSLDAKVVQVRDRAMGYVNLVRGIVSPGSQAVAGAAPSINTPPTPQRPQIIPLPSRAPVEAVAAAALAPEARPAERAAAPTPVAQRRREPTPARPAPAASREPAAPKARRLALASEPARPARAPEPKAAAPAPKPASPPRSEPAPAEAPTPVRAAAPEPKSEPVRARPASDDPLDRLMASAVTGKAIARPRNEIDRKLASVQKEPAREPEAAAPAAGKSVEAGRPALSLPEIRTVMSGVQKNLVDCHKRFGKEGSAEVKVGVDPEGKVIRALVRGELAGSPAGKCVGEKVEAATFPASGGGNFVYVLRVRSY